MSQTFARYNKYPHGTGEFVVPPLPPKLATAQGLFPKSGILDPAIGTETFLVILDPTPFVHQLATVKPFHLNMKSGLAQTENGPLLFLLFYILDPHQPEKLFAGWDNHIDPLNPNSMAIYRDLACQSHWHLILIGPKSMVMNVYEFENTYNLDKTLNEAVKACHGMKRGHFEDAKREFFDGYSIQDLFEL